MYSPHGVTFAMYLVHLRDVVCTVHVDNGDGEEGDVVVAQFA